ncbi:MAG: UDP-glucose/GDP-mannose dehydrogenase family protein [Acidobacteria bacterium]|jgi:UDPglucose 6-dehydrogenase|nr:UDP-glucose/GDP-mannose dehydrogenase family protein [Acidobacteriota bacterium]
MIEKVSVIGLGKLGASMVAAIASRGFEVIGVDVHQKTVDAVNQGREPVQETDLGKYISENKERIQATMSHEEAVLNSDISFVIVPTPSDEKGSFSLQYAAWAFKEIGKAVAKKDGYHIVVLTSTVLPGATRFGLLPILEKESGKKCGKDFGLCYSPEFIALGSIIRDFLNPDFTLCGEFDERCGKELENFYSKVMFDNPPCKRMSLENAELTKISVNTFVTTKITFANMLADLCERIPGGDVDVVTDALGTDSRIGRKYLTGALGYGGPCFPRDNVALSYMARMLNSCADIAETTNRVNRSMAETITDKLRPVIKQGQTVAILGLSYKPSSHVVEESQGIYLAKTLSEAGARVVAYDPLANESAEAELKGKIVILDSAKKCLEQADVVLITTADTEFKQLKSDDFAADGKKIIVYDFWRILKDDLSNKENISYHPIGCSDNSELQANFLSELWGKETNNLSKAESL